MTLAESAARPARPPLAGLEVLLVEDESAAVFVVEDMLFNLGAATVWHAADVDDALTLLRDHRPGIAVVDINLAGQPAYPVAERLQAAGIPFIFVTGYSGDGVRRRWSDHTTVQKPFRPATLAVALRAALDAQRVSLASHTN
ncbi:MAG: response regulator [Stellaceae bacterium]